MSEDRISRPPLSRKGPDRNFARVLDGAAAASEAAGQASSEAAAAAQDFVTDGVRNAYRVIDAYVDQGRRVAKSLGMPSYEPVPAQQMTDLSSRWIQAQTELISVWMELATALADSARPAVSNGARGSSAGLEFEIQSPLAARARHEILPGRETNSLATHGLRVLDSDAAAIDVTFGEPDEAGVVVARICVPDGQPAGLYTGALLDAETGETVGSLSLNLS